ncbi:MAG TPA: bifunctional serine/threonine-protein kinase/formylglycine-generating enzyme family protein [Anaerolineales bacterium]
MRVDQLLAHGGMAEVYLGTHLTLERPVAIKVLHSYVEQDPDLRDRFQREARVVAGFRHPNIVQVYDFDTIEGHPYIVMEYLNGPTLGVHLRNLHAHNLRLSPRQAAQLLKGPAAALDYAHALGVIHRDVKPGNIMLHGTANEAAALHATTVELDAVVTDFGLLRVAGATLQTSVGTIAGTPDYMSPEQATGSPTDYRTDIYSLGVVLYEMLAGRAPFDGDTTLTVIYKQINEPPPPIAGISAEMQAVVDRALAKKPADRYQSCAEMAKAYEAAISAPVAAPVAAAAAGETVRVPMQPAPASAPETAVPVNIPPSTPSEKLTLPRPAWVMPAAFAAMAVVVLGIAGILVAPRLIPGGGTGPQPTATATVAADTATPAPGLPAATDMIKLDAGQYQLGLNPADDFHAAQQMVALGEFWIDKYPVTNSQYQQYMQQSGAKAPEVWPGDSKQPVRGVTWDEASAYCAAVNKRLPSEAEWEAAGRGSGDHPPLFPWGNDPTDGGKALQLPDQDTYQIGTQPINVSSLGVYDLVGEVWQWVGDAYASIPQGDRILRGGRFGLPQDLAYRITVAPDDNRYVKFAGFRCAADNVK